MHYRRFPRIPDLEISSLGFGLMRLPTLKEGGIDEPAADAALLASLDAGVNYFDTAWPYHNEESESYLGRAMRRHGFRDRIQVATKSPTWLAKEPTDWDRFLSRQLEKLQTEHIDFYLLHALTAGRWEKIKGLGVLEAMERAKRDGRIGHLGFSFHDSPDAFRRIIDDYEEGWEFCQVQYNYVDVEYQAGAAGIAYAAEREIGVIVMEPLRGGALADPPRRIREIFDRYPKPRLPAEWALRFAWERQEVVTVLSGMGTREQVLENAGYASAARPNSMTRAETALVDEARTFFLSRQRVPCTGCAYCKPCPSGVAIPEIFATANEAAMYDRLSTCAKGYSSGFVSAGKGADVCTRCGECLPKCPQHIEIPDRLAEAHAWLTEAL